jgi:hypothetical protein
MARQFSRALDSLFDAIANERAPERWVDLISGLNDAERNRVAREQKKAPSLRPLATCGQEVDTEML